MSSLVTLIIDIFIALFVRFVVSLLLSESDRILDCIVGSCIAKGFR